MPPEKIDSLADDVKPLVLELLRQNSGLTVGLSARFCRGPAVAGDPVARRRPAPWAGPPGAVPGGAGRSAAALFARGLTK
jgi:hypothetical protein